MRKKEPSMPTQRTLAAIVDANPHATRVLEDYQLDYCCGGTRTLQDACAERGIDPSAVLAEIELLDDTTQPTWARLSARELVDHIETTHHRYLHRELPRLTALANKVASVHGPHHPELYRVTATYSELRLDLEPHLLKEENVLFPMIRQLSDAATSPTVRRGVINNPISMMRVEHDRAGELLATLRETTEGYKIPANVCASYTALYAGLAELEADTHLHVHLENNVLFPAVLAADAKVQEVSS